MTKPDSFLTIEEVLDHLQISVRTVYRLIRTGNIPAVRVGRQWRFRRSDLDEWLLRQSGAQSSAVAARRVLVVDDEPSVRDLLAKAFTLADHDVDLVSNGPEALDRVRAAHYRLLVTDLELPGMHGLTLIQEARRLDTTLAVIVVTGNSTETTAIEAANLRVSGYFTKPFKVAQVLAATARALGE